MHILERLRRRRSWAGFRNARVLAFYISGSCPECITWLSSGSVIMVRQRPAQACALVCVLTCVLVCVLTCVLACVWFVLVGIYSLLCVLYLRGGEVPLKYTYGVWKWDEVRLWSVEVGSVRMRSVEVG